MKNQDKFAFVTGSAKGLGRLMALALAEDGYNLLVHYYQSENEAKETVEQIKRLGRKAFLLQADLSKAEEVALMFDKIQENAWVLEVFVQNVGNYLNKNILEISFGEWREIMDTNLAATFYCNQLACKLMIPQGYGRVINIGFSPVGSLNAQPEITPYYIAKTGVLILTKSLAKELAGTGVTVNLVSPGVLETSIEQPIHEIPMGRLAALEEMLRVLRFLVAKESDYLTGTNIDVAGGWRL